MYILEKVAEYFRKSKEKNKEGEKKNYIDYSSLGFAIVVFYPTGLIGTSPKSIPLHVNDKDLLQTLTNVKNEMGENQTLYILKIIKEKTPKVAIIESMSSIYYGLGNSDIELKIIDHKTQISKELINSLDEYYRKSEI